MCCGNCGKRGNAAAAVFRVSRKIHEQIERADHLMGLLPGARTDWIPALPGARSLGWLLANAGLPGGFLRGFVCGAAGGTRAFLEVARRRNSCELRHRRGAGALAMYRDRIDEGFAVLVDEDLSRRLATVFVLEGEMVMTLLLGNLEHLTSHKYQLFVYVRMAGVEAGTRDLYQFRNQKTERT